MAISAFNTKDILLNFINLANPDNSKLDTKVRMSLVSIGNRIAQLGKELQNPLSQMAEVMKVHLGTPARGSKGAEIMVQLSAFENNTLLGLNLQHEELQKAKDALSTQYQLLIAQGEKLDPGRLSSLKSELERLQAGKWLSYTYQKNNATETLTPIKEGIEKISGKGRVTLVEQEERAAPSTTPTPPSEKNVPG